jgi:catechol-2,3-dioxygenase
MATTTLHDQFVPKDVAPIRKDPPGSITEMPSPTKMHHVHIFSDEKYDEMVEFYVRIFNGEVIRVHEKEPPLTFISYDDHDHRVVIIKQPGWGTKPKKPVGISHLAYGYSSLGEIIYIYKRMKEWGYPAPHWVVNHGNSTSMYYTDPDGNQVETMVDNFSPQDTQDYKRYYQFTEEFGEMAEGNFDPDKMVELYESGVPESVLMDREEVRRLIREGEL